MRKYTLLIGIALLIALNLNAQSTSIPIKLEKGKTVVKIDSNTCEITTIKTTTMVVQRDKAELQTELDHISDRRAKIQKQFDEQMGAVNVREAELIEILGVFK